MLKVISLLLCIVAYVYAQSGTAYATYHLYTASDSLTTVACSDGANGIMTKTGYTTLAPFFPYVTASSLVPSWNSPNCGKCVKLTDHNTHNVIYATIVDHCDPGIGGYNDHFDISREAFTTLCSSQGIQDGHCIVDYQVVTSGCQGNGGGGATATSSTTGSPSTTGSSCGTYTVQSGDTLSSIADSHGTTWQALCAVNNLPNCDVLSVGQVLKLC